MHGLWLYHRLSVPGVLNYRAKIMLMAFIGTHIPLIALLCYAALRTWSDWQSLLAFLGVALLATLAGTGATLLVLDHLLRPVRLTARTLRRYREARDPGCLPTHYTDEVGRLMADTAATLLHLESALDALENIDPSTGLANRRKLVAELRRRTAAGGGFAVCAVRFVNFARIRQTFDLGAADEAAKQLASRLVQCLRSGTNLARVGDGEFAFLLDSNPAKANDEWTARGALLEAVAADCGGELDIRSIAIKPRLLCGIASFPDDAADADALLDYALAAACAAPDGVRVGFHCPAARQAALERLQIEQELRRALDRNQFVLHYQPVVDLAAGRVTGAEALVRWQHPERGLLPPAAFIAAAEASGLIDDIGLWVARTACMQVRDWNSSGLPGLTVAVNLSASQFRDPALTERIGEALSRAGIFPCQLEVELTETAAMADHDHTRSMFARLRELGVSIAIDDFGTGYASMSQLRRLPFDKLKIDREFVADVHRAHQSQAICEALVALAGGLGLKLLAEGAEREDEVRFLRSRGCALFQGYFFSRPLPPAAFRQRIASVSDSAMAMQVNPARPAAYSATSAAVA